MFVLATFSMTIVRFGCPMKQFSRATQTLKFDSGKKCDSTYFNIASDQVTALTLDQDNSLGTLIGTLIFQRDNLLTPQRLADRDQWRRVTWNKHQ